MIRLWLALAMLSGCWLFGLPYVQPANHLIWLVLLVLGAALLSGPPKLRASQPQLGWAVACLLPAVWLLPWPFRAAPLLAIIGLLVQMMSFPAFWPKAFGRGALWAGLILLGQSVALELYRYQTARLHDLPAPLVWFLAALMRLVGVDAAANSATANGAAVAVRSMGATYRLSATWELLLDPATFCFVSGGLILLGLWASAYEPRGERWRAWLTSTRALLLAILVWLPLRFVLLVSLYLHRLLIEQTETASVAANQFVCAWPYVFLLAGPVLLAARLVRLSSGDDPSVDVRRNAGDGRPAAKNVGVRGRGPVVASLVLAGTSVAVFTVGLMWSPVGHRQQGRIKVVERHSTWEPTTEAYDTEWFGEIASYNYRAAYDYLSQYYEMSRLLEEDPIDENSLSDCDVLIIKIPTARFERGEVQAICRFVEDGGALLLVGDHTNVFNCSTYLNDIARNFGFSFRNDLLFCVGSPYKQQYRRPLAPHPAVQHVPWMDFAVSCSIDPGKSGGEMVMRSTGLWNLPPDYNASNYHPQAEYRPEMQLGAFCQAWATTYGKGRVLAFTDSTLFSNFCTFQEGKAELLRSMVEYLNHRSVFDQFWLRRTVSVIVLLVVAGLLGAAVFFGGDQPVFWGLPVAAGVLGWSAAILTVIAVHRVTLPVPPIKRPEARLTHVVVDRTVSEVPLSHGAFPQGDGDGYGLLEQWIPRLGNYTSRRRDLEAFRGDALVIVEPTRSVSRRYRDSLVKYVAAGGHVLLLDSPDNGRTTVNSLLWPFGLELSHAASQAGPLRLIDDWPGIELEAASGVTGGEPIAWVNELTVGAQVDHGQGTVTVVGFGYLFRDGNMGGHWMPDPDEETRAHYDILFAILEAAIEGRKPDTKWMPVSGEPASGDEN